MEHHVKYNVYESTVWAERARTVVFSCICNLPVLVNVCVIIWLVTDSR